MALLKILVEAKSQSLITKVSSLLNILINEADFRLYNLFTTGFCSLLVSVFLSKILDEQIIF